MKQKIIFASFLFLLFITSEVLSFVVEGVEIRNATHKEIVCGNSVNLTIRIVYRTASGDNLDRKVQIWEDDDPRVTAVPVRYFDDLISEETFYFPSSTQQSSTIDVQMTISCTPQINKTCKLEGNNQADPDDVGDHVIYAKVEGFSKVSNMVKVSCSKADDPGLNWLEKAAEWFPIGARPGENGTMFCKFLDIFPGATQISINVNYNSNYFSVLNADFDSSYYNLFDSLSVNYTTPGIVNFFASAMYPCSASTQIGYINFHVASNTPFSQYFFEIDTTSEFLRYSGPIHVVLGSTNLQVLPYDSISPVIDPYLISTNDSSVIGSVGAITDNYSSIPGYLEVSLYREDTSNIGFAVINNNGSFNIINQNLTSGLPLKVVAKDAAGNTSFVYIVSIQKLGNIIPEKYKLYQNYPNPFNPTTDIKFDIPKSTLAKIIIYNILGEETITLLNNKLNPGSYKVDWDGTDYPSGVYFYKLVTDDFIDVKKMVLVK